MSSRPKPDNRCGAGCKKRRHREGRSRPLSPSFRRSCRWVKSHVTVQTEVEISSNLCAGIVSGDEVSRDPFHWSWSAVLTDPVRLSILHTLCALQAATTLQLSRRCHSSDPTIRRHLEALEAIGLVREHPGKRDGLTPGRPASRYTLDARAADRVRALFELLNEPLVPIPAPDPPPPAGPGTEPGSCTKPQAGSKASAPSSLR